MARSSTISEVIIRRRQQRFIWPDAIMNIWLLTMLAAGAIELGIFANFTSIQNRFEVGIPWLFPFGITVGALTIVFIFIFLFLISQRSLLPFVVVLLSFILWALFLTGLIETSIQLFGPNGNINNSCQLYITSMPQSGPTLNTLAWLEQNSICQQWYAAFAFWIVGTIFLLWIFIITGQVTRNQYIV